jgi:hypothetical protein
MKKTIFLLCCMAFLASRAMAQTDQPVVIQQEGATIQTTEEEIDVRQLPFSQRLVYGLGGVTLQFGNIVNAIGAAPSVGYRLTNQLMVGAEVPLQHNWGRSFFGGQPYKFTLLGTRGYLRYDLPAIQQLLGANSSLRVEYEKFSVLTGNSNLEFRPSFLAGVGIGGIRGVQLLVMYDFNYNESQGSIYGSPLVIRGGISF